MTNEFNEAIKHYAKIMKVSEKEAREDAESTIKLYMETEQWPREFAESSWIEDTMDMTMEEMDEKEKTAKANAPKIYAKSTAVDAFGKKRERVRKPNEDKRAIVGYVAAALELASVDAGVEGTMLEGIQTITTSNVERQIDFVMNGVNYSITLTAHRAPKAK